MLPLPTPTTNEITLADWVELSAFTEEDRDQSLNDLERALNQAAVLEAGAIEEMLATVANEIRYRERAAGSAYPFVFDGVSVELKERPELYFPYLFCLCLSYFEWTSDPANNVYPARMFESLSCSAAKAFVAGESFRFAAPRQAPIPGGFRDAIGYLCTQIGEGEGMVHLDEPVGQDASLDVVAWRDFPDHAHGKLVLFGQCAAGRNWEEKVSDLQPRDFTDKFFERAPSSQIMKALFIPHRVPEERWRQRTIEAKLIFDRCRLAFWSHHAGVDNPEEYRNWYSGVLDGARNANA